MFADWISNSPELVPDGAVLLAVDLRDGSTRQVGALAGVPDVIGLDPGRRLLYAATDEAAAVEVFSMEPQKPRETYPTSSGAHTLTLDPRRHQVHVFLPGSNEDLILSDSIQQPSA